MQPHQPSIRSLSARDYDYIKANRILNIQLFRSRVDNKGLLKTYQEMENTLIEQKESSSTSSSVVNPLDLSNSSVPAAPASTISFDITLHPTPTNQTLKYVIRRPSNLQIEVELQLLGFGKVTSRSSSLRAGYSHHWL